MSMKTILGNIRKLVCELKEPVEYALPIAHELIPLNAALSRTISLQFLGEIHCIQCARKTTKSFHQGYCFPCYRYLLECNLCSIHPEKCRFYEGNCAHDHWAHAHCGQPHVIYLANSSGLKVGITRATHVPMRWIDQGASQGLVIMQVQNRYQSGMVEVALKRFVADKTHWQRMLKSLSSEMDLRAKRDELFSQSEQAIDEIIKQFASHEIQRVTDAEVMAIQYPILESPEKIKSWDLSKTPRVEGTLLGIKGQYLILDTGVINIRKFGGYKIEFNIQ